MLVLIIGIDFKYLWLKSGCETSKHQCGNET